MTVIAAHVHRGSGNGRAGIDGAIGRGLPKEGARSRVQGIKEIIVAAHIHGLISGDDDRVTLGTAVPGKHYIMQGSRKVLRRQAGRIYPATRISDRRQEVGEICTGIGINPDRIGADDAAYIRGQGGVVDLPKYESSDGFGGTDQPGNDNIGSRTARPCGDGISDIVRKN